MTTAKLLKGEWPQADFSDSEMSYWKEKGIWYLYLPGCGIGNLSAHKIVEHEDGTITISPSILVTGHDDEKRVQRHGYLERGIWRDC